MPKFLDPPIHQSHGWKDIAWIDGLTKYSSSFFLIFHWFDKRRTKVPTREIFGLQLNSWNRNPKEHTAEVTLKKPVEMIQMYCLSETEPSWHPRSIFNVEISFLFSPHSACCSCFIEQTTTTTQRKIFSSRVKRAASSAKQFFDNPDRSTFRVLTKQGHLINFRRSPTSLYPSLWFLCFH